VSFDPDWLVPGWQAPGVSALMTTRLGGVSSGPFDSMNLRHGLGDDESAVAANLAALKQAIGATPVWLNQVHGARVRRLTSADAQAGRVDEEADASVTTEPGIACAVQVADCLPVLFASPQGRGVGAAHAGWRGLAHGVLEATVRALCEAAGCEPAQLQAWLGACIGPRQFEVGADVLQAFGVSPDAAGPARFVRQPMRHAPGKWLADLPGLARDRLQAAGVTRISGGEWCTVEAPSRFFSYRRDRVTGRMAALVWLDRPTG
jgi:YfiH family protein